MDYAVTLTGPTGSTEQWEDHLDVLPDAALLGWPDDQPRLIFTVDAAAPFEALVEGWLVAREIGIEEVVGMAVEPSPEQG